MQPAQKKFLLRFVLALGAFYLLVAIPSADGKSGVARSTSFRIKRTHR